MISAVAACSWTAVFIDQEIDRARAAVNETKPRLSERAAIRMIRPPLSHNLRRSARLPLVDHSDELCPDRAETAARKGFLLEEGE
jgi:hypothetical protein